MGSCTGFSGQQDGKEKSGAVPPFRVTIMKLTFEWDEVKAIASFMKHKVSFDEGVKQFLMTRVYVLFRITSIPQTRDVTSISVFQSTDVF